MTIVLLFITVFILTISCNNEIPNKFFPESTPISKSKTSEQEKIKTLPKEWHNQYLRYIGENTFGPDQKIMGSLMGGISSLHFDAHMGQLLAISDDPGRIGPSRFFTFFPRLTQNTYKLIPAQVFLFKESNQKDAKYLKVDAEGIVVHPNGNILISTEAHFDLEGNENLKAQVLIMSKDAQLLEQLSLPKELISGKKIGTKENRGLEGLAISSDGTMIYSVVEEELKQDRKFNPQYSRFLVYKQNMKKNKYELIHEFLYERDSYKDDNFGVSELCWIDKDLMLSIERKYDQSLDKLFTKIYLISVGNATDVKNEASLKKDAKYIPLKKKLIVDFSDFPGNLLSQGMLGNLEGMSIGPSLDNHHSTLLLVNDNDFDPFQNTGFLAFEILKELK